MRKKKVELEKTQTQLDKRPWLMDWLFEMGQDLAIINHCNEKIEYLNVDIDNSESIEEIDNVAEKLQNYQELKRVAYDGYNEKMTYVFDSIDYADKENRCLLKHACNRITLAMEADDTLRSSVSEHNLRNAYKVFASAVSLALGIEYNSCIRCIYDGVKAASDEATKNKHGTVISIG